MFLKFQSEKVKAICVSQPLNFALFLSASQISVLLFALYLSQAEIALTNYCFNHPTVVTWVEVNGVPEAYWPGSVGEQAARKKTF